MHACSVFYTHLTDYKYLRTVFSCHIVFFHDIKLAINQSINQLILYLYTTLPFFFHGIEVFGYKIRSCTCCINIAGILTCEEHSLWVERSVEKYINAEKLFGKLVKENVLRGTEWG